MSDTIDQEFVKYIVNALVSQPDQVRVERSVDERGVLLTLYVAEDDLGRVIGRKGSTAQSLRVLLRALGSKNEAHYNLRIVDDHSSNKNTSAEKKPSTDESFKKALADDGDQDDVAQAVEEVEEDSLVDKTKKELSDLTDLDI